MADEKLVIDVTAKDDASKVIDPLQKKVDKLEGDTATVEVDADTKGATADVASFATKLERLGAEDQVVLLSVKAGAAQSELASLATDIATMDASDPSIDVKVARYQEVAGELDQLKTKITDIASTPVESGGLGAELGGVKTKLGDMRGEADQSRSVLANMVGNSAQDLGSLGGVAGTAGMAIGQLAEYATEGGISLQGLAATAGPMLILAYAMQTATNVAKALAEKNKTAEENQKAWTEAMTKGGDAAANYAKDLEGVGKVMADVGDNKGYRDVQQGWLGAATQFGAVGIAIDVLGKNLGLFGQKTEDITGLLTEAGFTAQTWAQAIEGGAPALEAATAAMTANQVAGDDQKVILEALTDAQDDHAAAADKAATVNRFFADSQDGVTRSTDAAEAALRRQSTTLDTLRGNLDKDEAWLNLEDSFDRVRETGTKAWNDVASSADGAEQSVRDHERATNDLKQSVIDYGTEVLGLPPQQVVDIVTNLDDAGLDDASRRLEELKRQAEIRIKFVQTSGAGFMLGSSTGAAGTSVPSLSAVAAPARWARINGR